MGYFDRVLDRSHNSFKVSKMINDKHYKADSKTLAYTVADMDFPIMKEVKEGIIEYMNNNTFGYTFPTQSYYDSVSNFFKRHHNFEFSRKDVLTFTGVLNMIDACIKTFTQENDKVLIFTPVYPPFYRTVRNANRTLVECPLINNNNEYHIDIDLLDELTSDEQCKMILFCSPHNPVSRVWTKEELEKLSGIALKNNCLIISDEIHCDFGTKDHPHTCLATLSEEVSDITMTCTSPSKTFNLASLNVANLIVKNPKLLGRISDYLGKQAHNSVNALGLAGCEAAYNHGDRWLTELNELLTKNTDIIVNNLSQYPQIKVTPRQGTYLMWIDMRDLKQENLEDLLKECGLYCVCGEDFGVAGKDYIRVNIACPTEYIHIFVDRVHDLMSRLNVSRETI